MEGLSQGEEEKHLAVDRSMHPPKPVKHDLIRLFLDQLGRVTTRDEAERLTELFLERYKGTVCSQSANKTILEQKNANKDNSDSEAALKQNKLLKRGMRILYGRYNVSLLGVLTAITIAIVAGTAERTGKEPGASCERRGIAKRAQLLQEPGRVPSK